MFHLASAVIFEILGLVVKSIRPYCDWQVDRRSPYHHAWPYMVQGWSSHFLRSRFPPINYRGSTPITHCYTPYLVYAFLRQSRAHRLH